jgi:chemotaxis protein MotB
MAKEQRPIVIRKVVKKVGGGHHGGSWKVAYADFVTAMMAFFMVMWILGMDENVKKAIEGYFSNPVGYRKGYSTGVSPISTGAAPVTAKTSPVHFITRSIQTERFREVGEKIRTSLGEAQLGGVAAHVEVVITPQGLRVELVEDGSGELFFPFGSAEMKGPARRALGVIARELASVPNPVVVEGHTDSAPFRRGGYGNWELSADRANATRQTLEAAGLDASRISEVRGYADRELRVVDQPLDPSNRRISILLPFSEPPAPVTEAEPAAAGAS